MNKKVNIEKQLLTKKESREQIKIKIDSLQIECNKLDKEIEELETTAIKKQINELNLPFDQIISLLDEFKEKKNKDTKAVDIP